MSAGTILIRPRRSTREQRASGGARSDARRSLGVLLVAGLVAMAVCAIGSVPALGASIVQVPVAFEVKNTNTSQAPCNSGLPDGATYTIRGHISGPQSVFSSGRGSTITLYLFGYEAGEWNWDLKGIAGYDYAAEMARRGHMSLTIDELGYGASGHPANGNETCDGAEADIAHQIVQTLRHGAYSLGSAPGIAFPHVLIAGHDVGGEVADLEAYSYADIDGLISVTFAHQGFTPYIVERSTIAGFQTCTESADGYAHFISEQEFRSLLFYNADPRVIDAAAALRNPNPCGVIRSTPPNVLVTDRLHTAEINVPVLIVFGDKDRLIWSRQGEEEEQRNYSGSSDVSTVFVPEAGHFPMLERSVSRFDDAVSSWLGSRFPAP
jgi:pimeloyl-ACP methyl ester carboxylesterase